MFGPSWWAAAPACPGAEVKNRMRNAQNRPKDGETIMIFRFIPEIRVEVALMKRDLQPTMFVFRKGTMKLPALGGTAK